MAYSFTCYGYGAGSEGVAYTTVTAYQMTEITYRVDQGDELTLGGFTNAMKFTATLYSGYKLSHWLYHIGTIKDTPLRYPEEEGVFPETNTFEYDGGENIYIRAVAVVDDSDGGVEGDWNWERIDLGVVDSETITDSYPINKYTMHRFKIKFSKSGTATFYTTSHKDVDTVGYLSTTFDFDGGQGKPYGDDYIYNDNGMEGYDDFNFCITCKVKKDTPYYLWVREYSPKYDDGWFVVHIIPPSEETSVEYWEWDASNGKASAEDTIKAHNAVENRGLTTDFSYKVWNDMVDKVSSIRLASGINWWDSTYGNEADAKFSGSNEILTAKMFNSLRNNLELVGIEKLGLSYRTGIGQVSKGDVIVGNDFIILTEYMNECIDNL